MRPVADLEAAALQQPGAARRQHGIKFQCAQCALDGHDAHQDNACLFTNGTWGCAFAKDTPLGRAHWDAIGRALGALTRNPSEPAQPAPVVAVAVQLSTVTPTRVEWVWPGRVARGKLTVVSSDPGLGKSLLTLDGAARVTTGALWPYGRGAAPLGSVVILSAEDAVADTIRPRLDAAGGDARRVHVVQAIRTGDRERPFDLTTDIAALESLIRQIEDVVFISVDPLNAYLGRTDSHRDASMRGVLMPLAAMAERTDVAVVAVIHLNKATKETARKAIYRTTGSIALPAAARMAFIVAEHPEDPARRVLVHQKNNLAPAPPTLGFRIVATEAEVPRVEWESAPVAGLTADDVLASPESDEAVPDAVAFLEELLAHGPVPADQGLREATALRLSEAAVRRAKAKLGVRSVRAGWAPDDGWLWVPGPKASPKTSKASVSPERRLGALEGVTPPKASPPVILDALGNKQLLTAQGVTCGNDPPREEGR